MPVTQRSVTDDEADIRLDRWFRRHYPGVTQGAIQKFCRTGQVRVDGKRADAATRLAPGQAIRVPPLQEHEAAEETEAPRQQEYELRDRKEMEGLVLYRDDDLIILNKPPGLATQGGPGIKRHVDSLLGVFQEPGGQRPRLVHRLDQNTAGALIVARTPGVAAKLAAAFRTRAVEKTYWAIVVGRPVPVNGRIEFPLVRVEGYRGERTAVAGPYDEEPARAITDYTTLDHAARKLAWLELKPLTGRTHQLRVHCSAIGAPILGDSAYGIEKEGRNSALVDGLEDTLHLHARRLSVPHPRGGTLTVEADLPKHMITTFRDLGFTVPPTAPPARR